MPRTEVTKKIWVYIKKNKLNNGRIIKPDSALRRSSPRRASTCSRWRGTSASTSRETLGEPRPFSRRVPTSRRALYGLLLLTPIYGSFSRTSHARRSGGEFREKSCSHDGEIGYAVTAFEIFSKSYHIFERCQPWYRLVRQKKK